MPDQQTPQTPTVPTALLQWQARSQPHVERSPRWYAIGGTLVIGVAAYAIMTGDWAFAIVVVLCGVMYFLLRNHVPSLKTIVITDVGVQYENIFTRWNDIAGFWFLPAFDYTELHFVRKHPRKSDIVIQTNGQDIQQLRILLAPFIPELTDKREGFLDSLIRLCKL